MHDKISTHDGRFSFVAVYPDGVELAEDNFLWNELPQNPMCKLQLVDFVRGVVLLELEGYSKYRFSNECTSSAPTDGGQGCTGHSAKIFAGIHPDGAGTEIRVDFSGEEPIASQTDIPADAVDVHIKSAYRLGT